MSLKHAILTLLLETDKTGYELSQDFDSSSGYYWSASHQQIYKVLPDMLNDKWVKLKTTQQDSKPDKKIYSITRKGKNALKKWVEQPTKKTPTKNSLLIKMLATGLVGPKMILPQLHKYLDSLDIYALELKEIEEKQFPSKVNPKSSAQDKGNYLTLRKGILKTSVERVWAKEAINLLSS